MARIRPERAGTENRRRDDAQFHLAATVMSEQRAEKKRRHQENKPTAIVGAKHPFISITCSPGHRRYKGHHQHDCFVIVCQHICHCTFRYPTLRWPNQIRLFEHDLARAAHVTMLSFFCALTFSVLRAELGENRGNPRRFLVLISYCLPS